MTIYDARALDSRCQDIRLLHIVPAEEHDDPLQCWLEVVSLRDSPRYRTLSYCWGDQSHKREIECDGEGFWVSQNLDDALRRVRALQVRRLWVDQICIDQTNSAERTAQVLIMHEVFRHSQECFVYLGQGIGEPAQLKNLKLLMKIRKGGFGWKGRVVEVASFSNMLSDSEVTSRPCKEGLFDIMGQPYFTRVWVIQELIYSRKLSCLWGDQLFEWDIILACAREIPLRQGLAFNTAYKTMAGLVLTPKVLDDLEIKSRKECSMKAITLERFSAFVELFEKAKGFKESSLFSMVVDSRFLAATDPRDKIFAMLNLARDKDDYPEPDYSWEEGRVWTEFSRIFVQKGLIVRMLALGGLQSSRKIAMTWSPDWVHPIMRWEYEHKSTFSAGGDRCNFARITPRHTVILKARILDQVSQISPYESFRSGLVRKLADFVQIDDEELAELKVTEEQKAFIQNSILKLVFCDLLGGRSDAHATYSLEKALSTNGISALSDYVRVELECDWRVNMGDTAAGLLAFLPLAQLGRLIVQKNRILGLATTELELEIKAYLPKAERQYGIDFLKHLNTIEQHTRIFVTEHGRLGLAPSMAQEGDVVAIIQGARAPYILRPAEDGRYQNVGQSYVRGLMLGEALKGADFSFEDLEIC